MQNIQPTRVCVCVCVCVCVRAIHSPLGGFLRSYQNILTNAKETCHDMDWHMPTRIENRDQTYVEYSEKEICG